MQRFGDVLNANPHFHSLVLDGVYTANDNGLPEFHRLPAPDDEDVLRLTAIVSERVQSLLERRELAKDADPQLEDPLSHNDPGMAALVASSVRRKIAVGPKTGWGVARLGDQVDADAMDAFQSPLCAMVSGFSVHANVAVEARDRIRLERLIRLCRSPSGLDGTFDRAAGWPASLPLETSMARRNHRGHLRTPRLDGQTGGSRARAAPSPYTLPWGARSSRCLQIVDCSGATTSRTSGKRNRVECRFLESIVNDFSSGSRTAARHAAFFQT